MSVRFDDRGSPLARSIIGTRGRFGERKNEIKKIKQEQLNRRTTLNFNLNDFKALQNYKKTLEPPKVIRMSQFKQESITKILQLPTITKTEKKYV